jgi:hypothetical protein
MGPQFGTLIWGVIWDPDLVGDFEGDMGLQFGTSFYPDLGCN